MSEATTRLQAWLDAYVEAWRTYDGEAIATGETRYADGNVFSNLFVLRFDSDGRCTEFVEWYVHHPKERATG